MKRIPRDIEWLIKKYMNFFKRFGMQEQNLRDEYVRWANKSPGSIYDYLWYVFQQMQLEIAKQSSSELQMLELTRQVNCEMMEHLINEEKRNAKHIKKQILENDVRAWSLKFAERGGKIEVLSNFHCCDYCISLNGDRFTFEDALKKAPLDVDKCNNPIGCSCVYSLWMPSSDL